MEMPNINHIRIEELIEKGKRYDLRKPFEYREIKIETGISNRAEGSARVKIGKTEVIVGVKMDTQEPYPDHEDEGTMITSMEISPVAGERYESGPPKMDAIEIARVVDRGVRESGFIDWKKLCIKEGEKVWSVLIDIYAINDDGNLLDASAMGAIAALKMAKMPVYDEAEDKIKYGEGSGEKLPLTEKVPFSITFHKVGSELIVDPTREEEDAASARLTLAVSKPKKEHIINAMQKGGITPLNAQDLSKIAEQVESIYDEIYPNIEKQVKKLEK